jgi:hypothetical protein
MGEVSSGHRWGGKLRKLVSVTPLAAVLLILLSPTSASAAASVDLPAGTSPTGAEAAEVSSYQGDFGVSMQTAEERLEVQADGAGIAEQLEASQGKRYAGVWFDNQSGEFVVPTVAGADRSSVAAGLAASDLEGDFRIQPAQSSWDELEAAQVRIDNALLSLIEEGLVGTSLDPRANAVVINQAAAADSSQRAEVRAAAGGAGVGVEVKESQDRKLGISAEACQFGASVCDAPMRGGVNIVPNGGFRGTGCTAGFKATGNTFGNRFVLTAGHCIAESGASKWDSFTAAPEERRNLGSVAAWAFPSHDYAAINANGTYWDKPSWPTEVAYWGVNQEYPINYESSSYVGEYVCHVGQQSGLSCGAVTGVNLTEPYEGGNYVSNLTRVEHICTIGGDSGGPVFAGNTALGIFSATDKPKEAENPCYYNGYYTEITEDTDALGVTVAPRVGAPPVGETGSASGFPAPHQATVTGTVDPNGVLSNFYFQYGTTTGYGNVTVWGGAGSGWQPTPVSKTLENLKSATTYHFRIVAQNAEGTSYGQDATFTTPPGDKWAYWSPSYSMDLADVNGDGKADLTSRSRSRPAAASAPAKPGPAGAAPTRWTSPTSTATARTTSSAATDPTFRSGCRAGANSTPAVPGPAGAPATRWPSPTSTATARRT